MSAPREPRRRRRASIGSVVLHVAVLLIGVLIAIGPPTPTAATWTTPASDDGARLTSPEDTARR
ncbi:hypothetical protein [Nocardioides dongkuii]|uniref:hypothetical protein n=1 Tax=Nocardioides dongkuii TaxID=2760089 RepID=UPI0018780E9C|nr:hypothetical protein [Nocardioides dongkuii]